MVKGVNGKMKKALALLISLVMILTSFNIDSYAATKKLNSPTNVRMFWTGEFIGIEWDIVEHADKYELIINKKTYTPSGNRFYIHRSTCAKENGEYITKIKIRAVSTNKSYTSSEYAEYNIEMNVVDSTTPTCLSEAAFLGKDDLVKYLKAKGYSPDVSQEDGNTIVSVSIKDKNNSGLVPFIKEVASGAASEGADSIEEDLPDIAFDAAVNGKGVKGKAKKGFDGVVESGKEGIIEGGIKAIANHALRDKKIHVYYYYVEGYEDYAALIMQYDYLTQNNDAPTALLKNWSELENTGLYYNAYYNFADWMVSMYEKTNAKDSRYVITFMPYQNRFLYYD